MKRLRSLTAAAVLAAAGLFVPTVSSAAVEAPAYDLDELKRGVVNLFVLNQGSMGTGYRADLSELGISGCNIISNNHVIGSSRGVVLSELSMVWVNYIEHYRERDNVPVMKKVKGVVVYYDKRSDTALVRADPCPDIPVLKFAAEKDIKLGMDVMAIGNPFGLSDTVTYGKLSKVNRHNTIPDMANGYDYQTDAAINPGNSGGPLLDVQTGRVIGTNTYKISRGGGLGFALRARDVLASLDDYAKLGHPSWPILGFDGPVISEAVARSLKMPESLIALNCTGLWVTELKNKEIEAFPSPAEQAGVKEGDIIFKIGDTCIGNIADTADALMKVRAGSPVDFHVFRDGKQEVIPVLAMEGWSTAKLPNQEKFLEKVRYDGVLGFTTEIDEAKYGVKYPVIVEGKPFGPAHWYGFARAKSQQADSRYGVATEHGFPMIIELRSSDETLPPLREITSHDQIEEYAAKIPEGKMLIVFYRMVTRIVSDQGGYVLKHEEGPLVPAEIEPSPFTLDKIFSK